MPLEFMLRRMRDKTVQDHTELPLRTRPEKLHAPSSRPNFVISVSRQRWYFNTALAYSVRE